MHYKLLVYFKQNQKYFSRYFIVGLSGFLLDISTLFVLKEFFGVNPVMAVVINQIIVIVYIFFLNKRYSFNNHNSVLPQFIKFLAVFILNYLFAIAWMWFGSEKFGFNYLLVRTANVALSVLWNYFLYKTWIFKHKDI